MAIAVGPVQPHVHEHVPAGVEPGGQGPVGRGLVVHLADGVQGLEVGSPVSRLREPRAAVQRLGGKHTGRLQEPLGVHPGHGYDHERGAHQGAARQLGRGPQEQQHRGREEGQHVAGLAEVEEHDEGDRRHQGHGQEHRRRQRHPRARWRGPGMLGPGRGGRR